ncbi:serine hydrolase-like protein isoform X2 [Choristoneura fumiferana]|uniref:serine hydrolase-like protein isoform X2 n=1 Tax=Choristoneura fumiferana TaxID=7141 RepID=UPI003D15CA7A
MTDYPEIWFRHCYASCYDSYYPCVVKKEQMSRKKMEELVLEVPWGKLAMATWGDSAKPPVLLVHGYVDSAATFVPLVNLLPDDYYYVALDLPGHGRSDPMPGPTISQLHLVESINQIVEQLRWNTFICIAHSMGYLISSYYNAAFPGRISKMVALDPPTPVGFHLLAHKPKLWFKHHIESYYDNYFSRADPRLYSYEEAVSLVVRARDVTEEQSELILSRSLVKEEDEKYSLTWGHKVKKISTVPILFDMFYATLSTKAPTLSVVASETPNAGPTADYAAKMFKKLQSEMKDFLILNVEGGHSVHFTNPESFVEYVIDFMKRDFSVKSKL